MEAVKNRLTKVFGNAGPFIIDPDPYLLVNMRGRDLHQAVGRREADRIVDDIVDGASQPSRFSHHDRAGETGTGKGKADIAGFAARFPGFYQLSDQFAEVDGFKSRPGQFGIGPRGFADIADQTVEADYILPNDVGQLPAQGGILDPVKAVYGGAQGGERVLELMRYVRRKGFD